MKVLVWATVLAAGLGPARSQPAPAAQRMDITLERQEGAAWKAVPPGFVFKTNDHLRFRLRSSFDGFLYVMNQGTSGQYSLLFPREETGLDNKIKSGTEYMVPSTESFFRVSGPPGFDIVYWVVTPIALGGNGAAPYIPLPPPPSNPLPQNLLPRCDDTIFKARGLCIDASAGPRNITADEKLPENLAKIPRMQSRDVVIMNQQQGTSISTPAHGDGPVLYEFRVAHQ